MHVELHPSLCESLIAREAAEALEACVHCGFCLATCPTYLDSRDERDSPRGRLYLIRELLEEGEAAPVAQHHLDRCLSCRSCETTCPSGVRYAEIADAGRELLEARVPRPLSQRLLRRGLRLIVPQRRRFALALGLAQALRPLLPSKLALAVPPRQRIRPERRENAATSEASGRRVLLLEGCVQASATPNTNRALRNILKRLGVDVIESPAQGCCGALNTHLAASEDGRADMRRNIDAWWPALERGVDAILVSATGCGAQVKDYGRALCHDTAYASRAAEVAMKARDPVEYLMAFALKDLPRSAATLPRVAVQTPCTQQHALGLGDGVSRVLESLGYPLCKVRDGHLCCGSAGSYSILQPAMSNRLRARKLASLCADDPDMLATANIGCQMHLQAATTRPVKHWLELVDDALA
ncbi:MAG: glycolate oxidase subunit GlcF [Halieaceae bacterium]|jgi:glycolate oxidase iron-sulfur subunit|nr:glycolate oxidase subunit GlcF [Halieaceae bacterium]